MIASGFSNKNDLIIILKSQKPCKNLKAKFLNSNFGYKTYKLP